MTELEELAAQLRALREVVDRLTQRIDEFGIDGFGIDGFGTQIGFEVPADPDADPFAWPSEGELVRYLAGRAPGARP